MNNNVIEVQVRAVLPVEGSFAIFLGDASKTFVIYVDESVGTAISMFMRGMTKERPLTHDLLANVLLAFGAKVDRVVINHINGPIFHARLIIVAENEIHSRKVIELDARPSDSIALAMQQKAPVFVSEHVWDNVEDVSEMLERVGHLSKAAAKAHGIALDDDEAGDDDDEDDFIDEDKDEDEDDEDEDEDFLSDEDDEDDTPTLTQ
jgi:uncharacterized protein